MKLRQIIGMAQYEMLIQWRRGSLRFIAVLLVLAPVVSILLGTSPEGMGLKNPLGLKSQPLPAEIWAALATERITFGTWAILPLVLFALPVFAAETIPYDRQYGVRGLLDSLPISHTVYLIGKLLAVWIVVVSAMILSSLLAGILGHLLYGSHNLQSWIVLWGGGLLIVGLLTSGLSILLAAGQPNRRRAVLVGLGLAPVSVLIFLALPIAQYYIESVANVTLVITSPERINTLPQLALNIQPIIMVSALVLSLSWLAAWGGMRWQYNQP